MPIEATTQTVFGNVYFLTGNDDLNVAAGVVITSLGASPDHNTEFDAILTFEGQHTFTIAGTVNGYDDGINTIGCSAAQTVEIAATGVINSGFNSPVMDADGVILDGLNSTLVNRGLINAQGTGVMLSTREFGTTVVTNYGTMTADKYGLWVQYSVGTASFFNYGTVESGLESYLGGVKTDLVTNAGVMKGDIDLREGDDVYVGTGGSVVGKILGGAGNDRFVTGVAAEKIHGGDGVDTLDFSGTAMRVTVDLSDASQNRGATVLGDTYTGIENISGSGHHDVLTGDATNNLLLGNGGRDKLSGGAGMDTLSGGIGADTLTGGAESDVFLFNTSKDGGEVITDFVSAFDLIRINGSAFGLGSYTGALSADVFVTGTVALDADDRFIFNKADATLWYDRDGSGGRAAILMVDFTDGTSLNFFDINVV